MLILLFLIFFGVVALFSYGVALGAYLCLLITHGIFVAHFGESAVHLPLVVGVFLFLFFLFKGYWKDLNLKFALRISIIVSFMCIATYLSVNMQHSVDELFLYLKGFVLALLVSSFITRDDDVSLLAKFCLLGSTIGALSVIFFPVDVIVSGDIVREAGPQGDPNDTAMVLLSGIPLAYWYVFAARGPFRRGVGAASLLLLLYAVLRTGSRGGWVSLVFVILFYALTRRSVRKLLLVLSFVAVAAAVVPQRYAARLQTLEEGDQGQSHSLENRRILLKDAVALIRSHPIFGVGPGAFGDAISTGSFLLANRTITVTHADSSVAHNLYLQFFAENGVIAFVVLIDVMFVAVRGLWLLGKKEDAVGNYGRIGGGVGYFATLSLLGMLIAGLFLSQGRNSVLWFLLGLGFGAARLPAERTFPAAAPAEVLEGRPEKSPRLS